MNDTSSITLVRALYQAFVEGRIEDVLALQSEDTQWYVPGTRAHIPWSGTWRGKQGVTDLLAVLDEALDVEAYEPTTFVAEGDSVIVVGTERVRSRATGKVHEGRWVHEWTTRDGKLARFHEHFDTDATAATLVA